MYEKTKFVFDDGRSSFVSRAHAVDNAANTTATAVTRETVPGLTSRARDVIMYMVGIRTLGAHQGVKSVDSSPPAPPDQLSFCINSSNLCFLTFPEKNLSCFFQQ